MPPTCPLQRNLRAIARALCSGQVVVCIALAVSGAATAADGIVVIGNANLQPLDATTVARIYTGKVVMVNGVPVTAVNAATGSTLRNRFLQTFLNLDEDNYTAYWLVRRFTGQGKSPRELQATQDVIDFVKSTPGAIGYVDASVVPAGVNVLVR
jgi:ABC-type phosphate transport system substrate-binding protein